MPNYVLKCEGCGQHRPFLVHEDEMSALDTKNGVAKHCPTCRMVTKWRLAFPERRSRGDRRRSSDRRKTE
jgi:hypothetical protein